jgi:PAS domain S-box-containing protein
MAAKQYPFIDVAVHERVRLPFARGEAVVLFSPDFERVLWANGSGAQLFGYRSIYDLLDSRPSPTEIIIRQVRASAQQLRRPGDARTLVMRIGAGFRSAAITAQVERIIVRQGDEAVLFSAPVAHADDLASSLLAGFDDPDTHMAVLDDAGTVLAASAGFAALDISEPTRRFLVEMAGRNGEWLVKRPVPTGKGQLPAAIGKISSDPPLHLLFAVETILGHLDNASDDSPAAEAEEPGIPEGAAQAEMFSDNPPLDAPQDDEQTGEDNEVGEQIDASAPIEATVIDDVTPVSVPEATVDEAETEALSSPDSVTDEGDVEPALIEAVLEPEDQTASDALTQPEKTTPDIDAPAFHFNANGRPIRFVWKIDAQGRFSEISDEFAEAVGARSAAIIGETFQSVAARYGMDEDGKIGDLLRRRDTWSGKTLLWPIEGTTLSAPVDLAALPTYSRNREFDGFRGFGIVRLGDAVEDPKSIGLVLAGDVKEAVPTAADGDAADVTEMTVEEPAFEPGHVPTAEDEIAGEASTDNSPPTVSETAQSAEPPAETPPVDDEFRGERPALRLVETPGRRQSDKVINLQEHRSPNREGLSNGEQAAFREIARQLGETFGKRRQDDVLGNDEQPAPAEDNTIDPATVEATDGIATADDAGGNRPDIAAATSEPPVEDMPGLEIGPHADDLPRTELAAIAPPRTRMDYGLTASVVDAIPVALLIHAGDRLIHANPEFARMTGYASAEALMQAGGLDILFDASADDTGTSGGTLLLRHADGEKTMAARARLQSVRWEDGSALMLALAPAEAESAAEEQPVPEAGDTATADDAPSAEQALIASLRVESSELRSILETATDGVVVVSQDGEIRSMNRSASALFNYDEDDTRGKPFAMLFAHESQKAVLDYLSGLSGHGVASVLNDGREVIGRESAGGFIPLFMTMGRLSSSSSYCAVIRDITQWKRTEEELRNAKRAAETANAHKSDFLARVSHEIRTPLNAIIGFSDMMATERFGPIGHPRYIEYANDIGRSGRHVLDIVNDLLDISKIEAGEMDLEFTAVGLNETIAEAVSLVQPQANSQRVIIRTSLSNAVPQVVADLRSIKQIALNILSNAIRFTPSGGQIVVSTAYEANGSVVLRIRDTGVGMTRSELEQAMKPFRQVTTGARKRGDGTGLGLPLTKAMVDANRANFAINSTPNEGTLVEITFPSPRVLAD